MERSGFEIVRKITPGILDVEVVRKQMMEGAAPAVTPFLRHLVYAADDQRRINFQNFLSDNRLSGNMLIFAKKVRSVRE